MPELASAGADVAERVGVIMMEKIEIHIQEAMKQYVTEKNAEDELQRNALLLYPYVLQKKISNGRAAEILGISKLDLIDLYGKIGFCYFDQIMDEIDKDLETFESLGLSRVTVDIDGKW